MKLLKSIVIPAIGLIAFQTAAFGQSSSVARSATPSPTIHRGNVGQSAIFNAPTTAKVLPGPIITPRPGHGHGNHGGGSGRPGYGHGRPGYGHGRPGYGHGRPGHGHHGHGHDHHGRCIGYPHFGSRYYHVHGPACVYTDGYYSTTNERVFVPARYENQYVPPRYELRVRSDGRTVNVLVANGYYTKVYIPERYETRPVQVWIPASWSCGYYY